MRVIITILFLLGFLVSYSQVEYLSTGTATAYDISVPGVFPLRKGMQVTFKAHTNCGSSPTVNISGNGPTQLLKNGGSALNSNDIITGQIVTIAYDGSKWQMLSPTANATNGTVTSVGITAPASLFTISGSPVSSTGTLTLGFQTLSSNLFFASPNGLGGQPSFRGIVSGDLPLIPLTKGGTNASLTAVNGGVVYSDASAFGITSAGTSGQVLQSNGAAAPSWVSPSFLPSGTSGQTLRHNGTGWVANSFLYNDGSQIGIGNSSPQATLHLSASSPRFTISNSASNTTNGSQLSEIWFNDAVTSNPQAGIRVFRDGAVSGDAPTAMAFYTTSTGSLSNSERMRITKDGRLGIGTNAPSASLHVIGGARFSALVGPGTVIADANGNLSVANGGTITGSGVTDYVTRWVTSSTLGTGILIDDGSNVKPSSDNVSDLGNSGSNWKDVYVGGRLMIDGQPWTGNTSNSGSTVNNTFIALRFNESITTGIYNLGVGSGSGKSITTGLRNTVVGHRAGENFATGSDNTMVGNLAGGLGTPGSNNTFLGSYAGYGANNTASNNTFVGSMVGGSNSTGTGNTSIGKNSLYINTTGSNNSVFGMDALGSNASGSNNTAMGNSSLNQTTGNNNAAFGYNSGISNSTGTLNTLLGYNSDVGSSNLINATAIGANAVVSQSNSLILGSNIVKVGIGISNPNEKLHIYNGKLKISDSSYAALLYQTGSKTTLETENPFVINPNGGGTVFQIDDGDAIFDVPTTINDPLRVNDGTQGLNKVFASDANGLGSWVNLSSLPGALSGGSINFVPKWTTANSLSSNSLIYDDGNSVGIGITIPGPSMLNVNVPSSNTSDYNAITVNNSYNGTLSKYGLNITNDANGSGAKYGLYANVLGSSTSGGGVFGALFDIAPNGSGSSYGVYSVLTGVGTGLRYGFYNSVSTSSTSISTVRGVYNLINPGGSGSVYGVHNILQTGGTGTRYGISNEVTTAAANAGLVYGTYNSLTPNGTGVAYSLYNYIAPSGSGERYGMYTDVNTTTTNASATYGQYTIMDNDGTGNSYGLYINSIGATTANEFGLYVVGEDLNYFSGKLGLGSTTITTHRINVVGTAGLSTGTAWTNTSDRRLKDIRGTYDKGLNEILRLNTVRFNYKKDNPLGLQSDKEIIGFIAQEVEEIIPEAINKRPDGYLELNVDPIHWAQINAIKELNSKIEKLCGRIEVLESENKSLKTELNNKSEQINSFEKEVKRSNAEILKLKNDFGVDLKTKN